jgi:K+-sensing histidine kinase KdpD
MRWLAVGVGGASSLFGGFQEGALISPLAVLVVVTGYNWLVSVYIWRTQPLARGRIAWVLLSDVVQAILATILTGGFINFYFFLFALAIIEAALAFYWQTALALIVSISILQAVANILNPTQNWDATTGGATVGRFFSLLIVGALVTLLSERVRLEDAARQTAVLAAARTTALNEISLRLGASALNLERTLATMLEGVLTLPEAVLSLVLLPDAERTNGQWRVAASNTSAHPVGEQVTGLNWNEPGQQFFLAGTNCPHPLPDFVAGDGIAQLVGVRLALPNGDTSGVIVVGRQTDKPLSDDEQTFLRFLALEAGLALRNVHLYAREQEQVDRLRRFEALQSTFFSATAHELRTPLTVLKTLTPTLRQLPHLPAQTQGEIIETIEQNLGRLEMLVTDLLEGARLEAGAIELRLRSVNLASRAQRVLDSLSPLLERKRQRASLRTTAGLPAVWADGRRVEQVLSNLIHNAAKFAPPDSAIEVELCPLDGEVQVSVADAGLGVPPHERERIFDKFYVGVAEKALAGVGLGLFICRELVRMHGGRIWVEGRPGGGSRFCFTLPLADENVSDEENLKKNSNY